MDTPMAKWTSTERHRFLVMYLGYPGEQQVGNSYKWSIGHLYRQRQSETLPAPSWKWTSTECQQLLAFHYGQSQCDVAVMVHIHGFDCFGTLKGSRILSGSSVNIMSCWCPGGCGGNIPYVSAYKSCDILVDECLWSSVTGITENVRLKMVDTLLTLILKMG